MCIVILKKDNDLLKYLSSHKEQMENERQKSNISTTTKSPEPHGESDSSPTESVDGLGSESQPGQGDGSKQSVPSAAGAQEKQNEWPIRKVSDSAHHGASKSRMRQDRSKDYKCNPIYPGMKTVLKRSNLSKRKYKMAKKQLQEECKTLLP